MSIYKSIVKIIIFSIGSKILGFFREILIAYKFGASAESDCFFVATVATGLFASFFIQSLNTSLIPVLADIKKNETTQKSNVIISNIITVVISLSIILTISGAIFSPIIIKMLAVGFSKEKIDLSINLMRIGIPVIIFSSFVGIFRSILQSNYKFNEFALSYYPYNFVYIIYLIFLSSIFGIHGLMIASVLAVFSQVFYQYFQIRKYKFKYHFSFDLSDKYLKRIFYMIIPILGTVAAGDINRIIDKTLASQLVEGSISALNYSYILNNTVLEIFIAPISVVLFPIISNSIDSEKEKIKVTVMKAYEAIIALTIPATLFLMIFSKEIIAIVFQRGSFDYRATVLTSDAMRYYSLGLMASSIRILTERLYYAKNDTRTPMFNSIISIGLNIFLNIILISSMQIKGLALATSLSTFISTYFLLRKINKNSTFFDDNVIYKFIVKITILSLCIMLVLRLIYVLINPITTISSVIIIIIILIFGVTLYITFGGLLRIPFFKEIIRFIFAKITSKR